VAGFDELHPVPPLSPEQEKLVSALSQSQIDTVDGAILSSSVAHWRKVAHVVSSAMAQVGHALPGVPDLFYAERVRKLVERGALDAQGDLRLMRYSEVRKNEI
jgi:hypothetical protein